MGRPKKHKPEVKMTEEDKKPDLEALEEIQTEVDIARLELEKLKLEIEEAKKVRVMPAREVSDEEMIIVKKQNTNSNAKLALKQKIEQQKCFDSVKVKGKFINRRSPGQPAKLTYMKYEDDPVKWYTFQDGGVYEIPRGFADQINEHYHTPKFIQKQGQQELADGIIGVNSSIADVDTSNKKYAFVPVSFAA
jgi:hypothetical protein